MMTTRMLPLALAAWFLPALASAQTPLQNGVFVTTSNANAGTTQTFVLSVPANMSSVSFETTGGSGNLTLAVDLGNNGSIECTSAGPTNEEYCEIANPAAGDYYLKLTATAPYAGVDLVGVSAAKLQDGEAVTGLFGLENSQRWYYIDVPQGQARLTVTTGGGSGDPDLAVGDDLFANPDCESINDGTAESCRISSPAPTRWYVVIDGFLDYTGVTLVANYAERSASGALSLPTLAGLLLAVVAAWRRRARARPV